jgi:hypothetical protein
MLKWMAAECREHMADGVFCKRTHCTHIEAQQNCSSFAAINTISEGHSASILKPNGLSNQFLTYIRHDFLVLSNRSRHSPSPRSSLLPIKHSRRASPCVATSLLLQALLATLGERIPHATQHTCLTRLHLRKALLLLGDRVVAAGTLMRRQTGELLSGG